MDVSLAADRANLAVADNASHRQAVKLVRKYPTVHSIFSIPERFKKVPFVQNVFIGRQLSRNSGTAKSSRL
jgi:hypothetical protein